MSKKKPVETAPWEVTADMFLSELEVDSLLNYYVQEIASRTAPVERRVRKVRRSID